MNEPPSTTKPEHSSTSNPPGGVDYLQHLRTEETFVRLREIFVKRWGVFMCISSITVVVQFLLSMAILPLLLAMGVEGEHSSDVYSGDDVVVTTDDAAVDDAQWANDIDDNIDDNNNAERWLQDATYTYDGGNGTLPMLVLVLTFALYYIVVAVSDGALIRCVSELYVSQIPTPCATVSCALKRIVPLVGTPIVVILSLLLPCFGLIYLAAMIPSYPLMIIIAVVFVLLGWFVSIATYHTYPVIMVEVPPRGIFGSLKRSWELSAGHREYILCVVFIFACFKLIGKWVLDTLTWALGNHYLAVVLDLVYLTFTAALGSILQAIVYFSVRVAKEGLTVDVLAQELQLDIDTPYESMATEMVENNKYEEEEQVVAADPDKEAPLV